MFNSVSFIGAGRIARIMMGGWRRANALPARILVVDANPDAIAALRAEYGNVVAATLEQAAQADLVLGALHPPALNEVLPLLAGTLGQSSVFCSLAPKIRLSALQEKLAGFNRLARMNPNAPSIIGEGYNPISFGPDLPGAARADLLALLKPLGHSPQVDERLLESYAVISAMGPTYFGFQFAEVERLATSFGLDASAAREAMRAMLIGTVDTLFASDLARDQALDLVPVRPMAECEADIVAMLQRQIGGIHAKLTQ